MHLDIELEYLATAERHESHISSGALEKSIFYFFLKINNENKNRNRTYVPKQCLSLSQFFNLTVAHCSKDTLELFVIDKIELNSVGRLEANKTLNNPSLIICLSGLC